MTQPSILELAKQGNPNAIATLLNRHLQPKGITVKAALKDCCLQVMLEASQVPNQEKLVDFIRKGITGLGVTSIERVKVYGRQVGEDIPAWSQEFESIGKILSLQDSIASESTTTNPRLESYSLKERARKGELDAIIQLLNIAFKPKKVTVTANKTDNFLQIVLEAEQVPDTETSMRVIRREWSNLKVESIKIVKVFGKHLNRETPDWEQEIKEDNIQSLNQLQPQYKKRWHSYTSVIKTVQLPDTFIKYYNRILQTPKPIKIGIAVLFIVLLGRYIYQKNYELQPISGKVYIVLGRGPTAIPDTTIRIIKCGSKSEMCSVAEDWIQEFDKEDYSSVSKTDQLKFLLKWSDLTLKTGQVEMSKMQAGENITKYSNTVTTDFNGDFSGTCDAPSCFLVASGEAGLASAFWFMKVKPGSKVRLSGDTAIYTYNKDD